MASLTFDTLRYAERLKTGGVPPEQAIAQAEALQAVMSEALESQLATKLDVQMVAKEVAEVRIELKNDFDGLKSEVLRLDAKMDSKFALVDSKFDKMTWMLGALIAMAAANFARQFF